jgi:hypothetical protein
MKGERQRRQPAWKEGDDDLNFVVGFLFNKTFLWETS